MGWDQLFNVEEKIEESVLEPDVERMEEIASKIKGWDDSATDFFLNVCGKEGIFSATNLVKLGGMVAKECLTSMKDKEVFVTIKNHSDQPVSFKSGQMRRKAKTQKGNATLVQTFGEDKWFSHELVPVHKTLQPGEETEVHFNLAYSLLMRYSGKTRPRTFDPNFKSRLIRDSLTEIKGTEMKGINGNETLWECKTQVEPEPKKRGRKTEE